MRHVEVSLDAFVGPVEWRERMRYDMEEGADEEAEMRAKVLELLGEDDGE